MRIAGIRSVIIASTIVLFSASPVSPIGVGAVQWDAEWEVTVGRSADSVATDANGDVYVTGTVRSADGYWRSMVIVKYAPDGGELWRRTWPTRSERFPYSIGRDVAISLDGDTVFVAGAELNDSTEHARAKVWAYTAHGDLRWHRAVWGPSSLVADGIGVGPAGPVVGGAAWSEYPLLGDGRVAAFADDGTKLWTAPFEVQQVHRTTRDAVFDIAVDHQGIVYAVGVVERRLITVDDRWEGVWSDADTVIQRFDPDGRLVWSTLLTDPGVKDRDSAFAIDVVGRAVMVAGLRDGSRVVRGHAWLARMSPGGRVAWSTDAGARPSVAYDVAITPWGDVQLVGETGVRSLRRLFMRAYSFGGELLARRHLDGVGASGVAASDEPALYVVGGRSLWRLPA